SPARWSAWRPCPPSMTGSTSRATIITTIVGCLTPQLSDTLSERAASARRADAAPWRDAARSTLARARRCLSPHGARSRRSPDLPGRLRSAGVRRAADQGAAEVRMAVLRDLPDGHALPARAVQQDGADLRRHAQSQRRSLACVQRASRPTRSIVRVALSRASDSFGRTREVAVQRVREFVEEALAEERV